MSTRQSESKIIDICSPKHTKEKAITRPVLLPRCESKSRAPGGADRPRQPEQAGEFPQNHKIPVSKQPLRSALKEENKQASAGRSGQRCEGRGEGGRAGAAAGGAGLGGSAA